MLIKDLDMHALVDVAEKTCPSYACYWPRPDPGIFTQGQGYRARSTGERGWLCGTREARGCPECPKTKE